MSGYKMTSVEFKEYKEKIRNWEDNGGSKVTLQKLYDEIVCKYEDGRECLKELDKGNHKWPMDLHQINLGLHLRAIYTGAVILLKER